MLSNLGRAYLLLGQDVYSPVPSRRSWLALRHRQTGGLLSHLQQTQGQLPHQQEQRLSQQGRDGETGLLAMLDTPRHGLVVAESQRVPLPG